MLKSERKHSRRVPISPRAFTKRVYSIVTAQSGVQVDPSYRTRSDADAASHNVFVHSAKYQGMFDTAASVNSRKWEYVELN